jgi:hypothetical protein
VGGWLLTSVTNNQALSPDEAAQLTKEQQFLASLHATVNGPVEAFRAVSAAAGCLGGGVASGYGADESDDEQEEEEMEMEKPVKAEDISAGKG